MTRSILRVLLTSGGIAFFLLVPSPVPMYAQTDIRPEALQQMRELLEEKEARTATQRKLGSQLVYALKTSALTASMASLPGAFSHLDTAAGGVLVDLRAPVSNALLSMITQSGGRVITASAPNQQIRARIPLARMEAFASQPDVQYIKPGARAKTHGWGMRRPWTSRSAFFDLANRLGLNFFIGSLTTQGDISHSSNVPRASMGITGAGVRVGVLSDSAEATSFLIGTGDLPGGTTIVQEIISGPGRSEGTAVMEVIYDMAPGVQFFFASAFNGEASFADNIRLLRNMYRCDVIVDDVSYADEFPFQDGIVARAVNDVTGDGAIYISSAGNGGNLTSNTSSTWEGDFSNGGTSGLIPGYALHDFGGQTFNTLLNTTPVVDLFWSDPIGASSNDYDLFILDAAGSSVLFASTNFQTGFQDPLEEIYIPSGIPGGSRIVIAAKPGAEPRALHLSNLFGAPFQIGTAGATRGHNGGPSTVTVAAVYWNSARTGTRPFTGGMRNSTEIFSSDGPRKMFYHPDGTPITPGNLLFRTNGGTTFMKPTVAAADGVTARTPGFSPFFGTSAAAAHAAGVAALIKSARPSLRGEHIHSAITSTVLDIRAAGVDRDSGFGIVMAPVAISRALQ